MEKILKFSFIAFSFLVMLSSNSYAFECNTVMGGCPTDPNAGATSAHMRSENLKAPAPQTNTTTPTTGTKSSAAPSTTSSKKSQGSLLQTINKNVLK